MLEKHKNNWDALGNQTRFYILTGGRGSSKSFSVSLTEIPKTFKQKSRCLFTRYTMSSAHLSIIPEYLEKIELLNLNKYLDVE